MEVEGFESFKIKTASVDDIDLMLEWIKLEGWNPGLYDATPFHVTDPTGFFVGYLNEKPIASISVVRYSQHFGFLGSYIVKSTYRGLGYGLKLWQHGIDHLHGYNIGLDGVIAHQDKYKQYGFQLSHRNIRFSGLALRSKARYAINAREIAFNHLLDYDQLFFPAYRKAFLAAWLNMPESHAYAVMQREQMVGYGVIRKCHMGYSIGPLFAEDAKIAEDLLFALCEHADTGLIFIDVPEINLEGVKLLERYNYKPLFTTARMYTGELPAIDWRKVFGITTIELG